MFSFSLASLRDWHRVCVARRGNGDVKCSSTCVSCSASCISDPTMPCGYPCFLVVVSPMTFLRYPKPSLPPPTLARSNSPLPLADRRRPANRPTHGWCPLARAGARLANRWHAKCDVMRHQVAPQSWQSLAHLRHRQTGALRSAIASWPCRQTTLETRDRCNTSHWVLDDAPPVGCKRWRTEWQSVFQ